jgi:hypothetical protein
LASQYLTKISSAPRPPHGSHCRAFLAIRSAAEFPLVTNGPNSDFSVLLQYMRHPVELHPLLRDGSIDFNWEGSRSIFKSKPRRLGHPSDRPCLILAYTPNQRARFSRSGGIEAFDRFNEQLPSFQDGRICQIHACPSTLTSSGKRSRYHPRWIRALGTHSRKRQ